MLQDIHDTGPRKEPDEETRLHLTYGQWGPNGLRRHLARDHGLSADPEFKQHDRSTITDWWGNHVRWQLRKHAALHGGEYQPGKMVAKGLLMPWWLLWWKGHRAKVTNPHNAPPPPTAVPIAPAAPPGWYADPHGGSRPRYWDGSQWVGPPSSS